MYTYMYIYANNVNKIWVNIYNIYIINIYNICTLCIDMIYVFII